MFLVRRGQDSLADKLKFNSFIVAIQIIVALYSIWACVQNSDDCLWFLPFLYLCVYVFTFCIMRLKNNMCTILITTLALIRYTLLPALYYIGDSNYNYTSYITYTLVYTLEVVAIMSVEMFSIFLALNIFTKYKLCIRIPVNKVEKNRCVLKTEISNSISNISIVIVFLGVFVLLSNPQLIRGFTDDSVSRDVVAGSSEAIFQVAIIVLELICIEKIEKINCSEGMKAFMVLLAYIPLIYLSSYMATSVARNGFIINAFVLILILSKLHPRLLSRYVILIGGLSIFFFCWTSYQKFTYFQISSNIFESTFNSFFNYPTLNAYFSGPTNIEIGIDMIREYGSSINIFTFLNDIFSNIPVLNKLTTENNSLIMFNYSIFHGVSNDQIIPITIQSCAYFGYIFCGVIVFFATWLACYFYYELQHEKNILSYYGKAYICVVLSMAVILSVNAVAMLISMRALPLIMIDALNWKNKR